MCDRIVELVEQENDVLFNLLSLKHKLLLSAHECAKCLSKKKDWCIISTCHHEICSDCLDIEKDTQCPVCNIKFDPKEHVSTIKDMRIAYNAMEELIWNVLALEKRTLDNLYVNSEALKNRPKKLPSKNVTINNIEMQDMNDSSLKPSCSQSKNIKSILKKLSTKNMTINNDTEMPDMNDPNLKTTYSQSDNINSVPEKLITFCIEQNNLQQDILKQSNSELDIPEQKSSSECTRPQSPLDMFEEVQGTQSCPVDENHEQPSEEVSSIGFHSENSLKEDKNKMNIATESINCNNSDGIQSEDDIIVGTPERSFESSENICLCISHIENEEDLDRIFEFVSIFKIRHELNWCNEITHLVVSTDPNGFVNKTSKYVNALLSHSVVVNIEWIKESLISERLMPVVNYMPKDESGVPSALISWQVGQGIIRSPLEWCKNCALHFHSTTSGSKFSSNYKIWAEKVGFVVLNKMSEFKNCQLKMRFILYDTSIKESVDPKIILPGNREMISWICDYQAVTLDLDWFLECLFQFKFVKIGPSFQVIKLNKSLLDLTEMDASYFAINCNV